MKCCSGEVRFVAVLCGTRFPVGVGACCEVVVDCRGIIWDDRCGVCNSACCDGFCVC